MSTDMLIRGARIIDPARNIDDYVDVRIMGDRIVTHDAHEITTATKQIHAEGCILTPGLIDYHSHVFHDGTYGGVRPDICMLPNGVTTVVDAGSAGYINFRSFYQYVICTSKVWIKAFLAISPAGQTTIEESYNPEQFNPEEISTLFAAYPDILQGLKLKVQTEDLAGFGITPLVEALKIAEKLHCPIAVHATNPVIPTAELIQYFRAGDIFAHAFHGKGSTIIGPDQHVLPEVLAARQRNVFFDAANGRSHFSADTARKAIADGFYPDIISSDMSSVTKLAWPVFGLPWLISKYLALGMPLPAIIAACTTTPAKLLHMEKEIGTLAPGAFADIALFRLKNKTLSFTDIHNEEIIGEQVLVPQMTIKSGEILYRQIDF